MNSIRARQLVGRDPALAAVLGLSAFAGSNPTFGAESSFGDDFGGLGNPFGDDSMGDDFGDEFGFDVFGADGAAPLAAPMPSITKAQVVSMARQHVARQRKTKSRTSLLNPNGDSNVKVDKFSFSVPIIDPDTNTFPLFGTASSLSGQNTPDVYFRPTRATLNINMPGLVYVNEIKVGNVSGTVGGIGDGYDYSPQGQGMEVSLPLLTPSTKATFLGSWTEFLPPAYVNGAGYRLVLSFKGPATLTPQG